jgi:hypothetical protein
MEQAIYFETSVTLRQLTQCHISEDLNLLTLHNQSKYYCILYERMCLKYVFGKDINVKVSEIY